MKQFLTITLFGLITMVTAAEKPVAPMASFTEQQRQAIDNRVHRYLIKHPEVLIEASQILQHRAQVKLQARARREMMKHFKTLVADPKTPTLSGTAPSRVALIEFFDYQCVHCKASKAKINTVARANPDLRIVLKNLPILGERSIFLARASLAAYALDPKKFRTFHRALLSAKSTLPPPRVIHLAKQAGYDTVSLIRLTKQSEGILKQNADLAHALGIIATPTFIVVALPKDGTMHAKTPMFFVPGAIRIEALQRLIDQVREDANEAHHSGS